MQADVNRVEDTGKRPLPTPSKPCVIGWPLAHDARNPSPVQGTRIPWIAPDDRSSRIGCRILERRVARCISLLENAAFVLLIPLWCSVHVYALEVEVTGLDGRSQTGRLVRVMPEFVLESPTGEIALAWSDILSIKPKPDGAGTMETVLDGAALPETGDLQFQLSDGSLLYGRIVEARERDFTIRFHGDRATRLEISWIDTIAVRAAGAAGREKLNEAALATDRSEDIAVVERGAKVVELRGEVRRVDAENVMFLWNERELSLPWQRLAGVVFAHPQAREGTQSVVLANGEVFKGRVIAGDERRIVLKSSTFDQLELSWAIVDRIECRSGRLTYLSDLTPVRYDFTPFLIKKWPYARDATLLGREIRLAGRLHQKGVTMHSRAALTYNLGGQYRQFAVTVGISDEMRDRGDVTLAVLGDGRVLWEASNVRGGQPPLEVLIEVTGIRELSLHVDFGEDLDLSDHVCWGSARLVR